jgi:hypothetical protein
MNFKKDQLYFKLDTCKLAADIANENLKALALHPQGEPSREASMKSSYSTLNLVQRQLREYLSMDLKELTTYEDN